TTGMAGYGDIIRAELERARLQDELASLKDGMVPLLARINRELNRSSRAPIAAPDQIEDCTIELPSERTPRQVFGTLELLMAEEAVEREQIGIALARKKSLPDVELGIGFREIESSDMPMSDNGRDPVLGMVSVNLPIRQSKYKAMQREAEQKSQMAIAERDDLQNRLVMELEMILYDYRDARRKLALYEQELIPKAQKVVSVTQQAFATGKVDFLKLIDTQRVLLDLQLNREQALTDSAKSIVRLEVLSGRDYADLDEWLELISRGQ
ncbi:MAG TPA: TolC family protein, partial [bacterium]|nr:TolC family protein [bacterium]